VDDCRGARGDVGIKKSEVSRICPWLNEIAGAFRTRRLDHVKFPYVYLDATQRHPCHRAQRLAAAPVDDAGDDIGLWRPARSACSVPVTRQRRCVDD
jgi:hypothetical protein